MLRSSALFSVAWPPACGAGERTTRLSAVCCAHTATQPTRGPSSVDGDVSVALRLQYVERTAGDGDAGGRGTAQQG